MSDQSPTDPPPGEEPMSDPLPSEPTLETRRLDEAPHTPPETPPLGAPSAAPPERAYAEPVQRRGSGFATLASLLGVLAFLALVAAVIYLYVTPGARPVLATDITRDQDRIGALTAQVQALSNRVEQLASRPAQAAAPSVNLKPLEDKVAALEQRPQPAPVDLKPLEDKVAALEARPQPAPVNLKPLEAAVAALAARPQPAPVDLKPLENKIAALEARPVPTPPPPAASPADLEALSKRFDQLAAQQDSAANGEANQVAAIGARLDKVESRLGAAEQQASSSQAAVTAHLDKIDSRLAAAEHSAGEVAGLTTTAQHLARLQGAAAALDAGQPLGTIPDASPALARFATKPPPTMSELRLSFPAAAEAAHEASQPAITQGQPFLDRLWTRAQQSVTVREGTRVVLGDPVAGVLAQAQHSLDAGDLAGAVQALDGLAGPAAAAMKPWRDQAQSLLDARAALAKLAASEG